MKKFTPFIFPLIVLGIVIFLLFRWYQMRTNGVDEKLSFGEGIEIEDLSGDELDSVMQGGESIKTVELQPETTSQQDKTDSGVIRYEVVNNRVAFSVITQLPEPTEGVYQVWLKDINSNEMQKAFVLEPGKGGFMGGAAVSTDLLPFEVVVSQEKADDDVIEQVILRGRLENIAEEATTPQEAN